MRNKISALLLFIFIIVSSSCKHELETPSWDVDIITPLVTTHVTIDKINIEDSLLEIQSNDSGLVSLVFNDNLSDQVYKKLIGLIQTGSAKIKLDNENKITLDVSENNNKRIAVAGLLNELV